MTLFQNIMGCLVAVLVFERMDCCGNQAGGIPDWLPDLLGRVRALPWFYSVGRFGCSSRAGGVFSFPGPSDVGYRRDYD